MMWLSILGLGLGLDASLGLGLDAWSLDLGLGLGTQSLGLEQLGLDYIPGYKMCIIHTYSFSNHCTDVLQNIVLSSYISDCFGTVCRIDWWHWQIRSL
jgi:hypothetical protein